MEDLFAWSYEEEGRFARTSILIDLLRHYGIAQDRISTIFFLPKGKTRFDWDYHVTAVVQTDIGMERHDLHNHLLL